MTIFVVLVNEKEDLCMFDQARLICLRLQGCE